MVKYWLWVDSIQGLLDLVEIGVVEWHPWAATVDDIERPDTDFRFGRRRRDRVGVRGRDDAFAA